MKNYLIIVVAIIFATTITTYSQSMFADEGEFGAAVIGGFQFYENSRVEAYGASATIGGIIEVGVAISEPINCIHKCKDIKQE